MKTQLGQGALNLLITLTTVLVIIMLLWLVLRLTGA